MLDVDARKGNGNSGPAKKVLIVDDSRVMRAWLRSVLSSDPRLKIVGEASNAVEARDFLRANPADVVTLDIEMPGMSGLDFLTRLMRARPMPVVMMSSLTTEGSDAAIQALSRGAIDCMLKPTNGYSLDLSRDICDRVYQASCTNPSSFVRRTDLDPPTTAVLDRTNRAKPMLCRRGSLILIGASTGGVAALETVLPALDPTGPPVVIVQHMPGNFLTSFAARLNRQLPQTVKLAKENVILNRGDVILAPGDGVHTHVQRSSSGWTCRFAKNDPPALHCPSVDHLFHSAVEQASSISAAILTGLGKDGADGLLKLAQAGACTFGQDEESSVVYGMPRVAFMNGAVQKQLSIDKIGDALRNSFSRQRREATARRQAKQL